jgi:hypothetical protein
MAKQKVGSTYRVVQLLIGVVTFWNLQAAVVFLLRPGEFAPGFELTGKAGEAMIQGLGLLFVMWNVPYCVALLNPLRNFTSLIEALIMQGIGAAGETLLLIQLHGSHPLLAASVKRFILFDSTGVILLLVALLVTKKMKGRINAPQHN